METEDRIAALEAQVRSLSDELSRLRDEKAAPESAAASWSSEPAIVRDVRDRIDRALRGDGLDTIESRIGTVWVSRLTVLLIMTAVALGTQATVAAGTVTPEMKALGLLAMSAIFTVYGIVFRRSQETLAEAILGCGLSLLYYAAYAVFYVEPMRLVHLPLLGVPVLLACLLLMGIVAHWQRSLTVAGISVFLTYYTVVVSSTQTPTLENLLYALGTCSVLAVLSLVFHMAHRWMLFSWAVLIATHGAYLYFFWRKPAGLELDDQTYFWISNGFLTLCYLVFSLTCILDARKTGEYRKGVAPMSGVNSFIYLVLVWFSIRTHYLEEEWLFRGGIACMLLALALTANWTGPRRNYLFQIFAAKTIIMVTLALQAFLSGEKLIVAMAIECLGLAFSYRRSGIVMFKVMGLGLMAITFAACLFSLRMPGNLDIVGLSVRANWFSAVGAAFVFTVVAWYYEKFVRSFSPDQRTTKGQWFLADSLLDLHNASIAILHASAAALILLTITILELGEHPALPFLLTLEGVIMALWGLLLRTPQIDIASVLLITAAHVCFHVFLWLPVLDGFEQQPNFVIYTTLLAGFTYIGALAWERYLNRYRRNGSDLEHHVVASVPYLAATFMLTTLIARELHSVQVPAAQGALGMGLLLLGSLTHYSGIKASGVMAILLGCASLYFGFFDDQPITDAPLYLLYLVLFLFTFAGSERLFVLLHKYRGTSSPLDDILRTLLVGAAALLGIAGLYLYNPGWELFPHLLGMTIALFTLGAVFREGRYRWSALFLIAVVCVLAFTRFSEMTPFYRFVTFGAAAAVTLIVSWAYTRVRRRAQEAAAASKSVRPDGAA